MYSQLYTFLFFTSMITCMKTRGERLKERRLELDLKMREVAKDLNISISGVQNLEKGNVMPALDLGLKLARLYEKSVEWIISGHEGPNDKIPVVGNTQAGPDNNWLDNIYPENWSYEYISFPSNGRRIYALKVVGDSMSALYQEGDVVLVDADAQPVIGEDVVVRTTRDETMIKKLARIDNNQIYLDSTNDQFKRIIRNSDEITMMHTVIGSVKSFMVKHR